jgi:hypothetical protein
MDFKDLNLKFGQCSSFEWLWAQLGEKIYLKGGVMIACIIRDPYWKDVLYHLSNYHREAVITGILGK